MKTLILALALAIQSTATFAAPVYTLEQPDPVRLADLLRADEQGRYAFATALGGSVDSAVDGAWEQQGENRIWRAKIYAAGAQSLSLQFAALQWPSAASLTLFGVGGRSQGPYTHEQVRDGVLWTGLLHGESVEIQWTVPADQGAHLRMSKAYYGARDPGGYAAKHGDCNNDVVCPLGNDFSDQINSTVLLQITEGNSVFACSGFLVNNTRNDRAPYVLTADHCGITRDNDDSVQVYWRYEDSSCGNSFLHGHPNPDASFSRSGVELLADGNSSDFTLIVVGQASNPSTIPDTFLPFWSGWDVANTAPQNGVGVHHPSGDEKSISIYNSPGTAVVANIDGRSTASWRVNWDDGTTEPGSSGSGLWNQNGLAVGVLSGGGASCSDTAAADFYGRLNVAWQEFETCDRQLQYWLDPDFSDNLTHTGVGQGDASPQIPSCTVGAVVVRPPSATPMPTPTVTPQATATPGPTAIPMPSDTPIPTTSPSNSPTPTSSATPGGSAAPTAPTPRRSGGSGVVAVWWYLGWLLLLLGRNMMRRTRNVD